MDSDAERQALENEQAVIQGYLNHPITKKVLEDLDEQAETCIELILNHPVINIETFLAREQALGHLRGLRRPKAIIQDSLEEIESKLKQI